MRIIAVGWSRHSLVILLLSLAIVPAAYAQRRGYDRWLNEDVRWIITPQERADFLNLSTDKQRDDFIVAFWARRDSTPNTAKNEFKEEHYRRLAFANTDFAAGKPGWETDRGRIYIVYGPPDDIEHSSTAAFYKTWSVDSRANGASPYEIWHYSHLKDAENVNLRFVDDCMCGEYHLSAEQSRKYLEP